MLISIHDSVHYFTVRVAREVVVVVVVVVDRLWPVRARFQTGAIKTGKILSKSAVENTDDETTRRVKLLSDDIKSNPSIDTGHKFK